METEAIRLPERITIEWVFRRSFGVLAVYHQLVSIALERGRAALVNV